MNERRLGPDDWADAIEATEGPQLVVAGPGAGKTEFLVRRAIHLVNEREAAPHHILMLSFSRRGTADLRERVTAGLARSFSEIPAMTFHSLSMRLLEAHGHRGDWGAPPALLTGPEHVALVSELLADEDLGRWPKPFRAALHTRAFAAEVADFVLRAAEHLLGPDEVAAMDRPAWRALPAFLARYRATLAARGRIDYGTLQSEALGLISIDEVATAVADTFRYVLVDEYQDTTVAQAALLEAITADHRNITVAGDPYQSIYSFRGAELGNIARFPDRFRDHDDRPAKRIVLTTSFRVPEKILDAAVRLTAGGGLPGEAGPVVPASGGGLVETHGFDQHTHEAEWIAAEIQRVHLRDRLPFGRIAVLVRSKRRFLPELSRALHRRGIPHDPPDGRLTDHPIIQVVLDLARAASAPPPDRVAALRRVLLGPLVGVRLGRLRDMERAVAGGEETWPDLVRRFVDDGEALADLFESSSWAEERPASDGLWAVWTSLPHFADVAVSSRRADDRAAIASFAQVLERTRQRDPSLTLARYAAEAEAGDFEATPLLEHRPGGRDRVVLTTLHQAKGREFDIVFIADARDGVLPDLRIRDSVLGLGNLSEHGGDVDDSRAFRLQEERRLAYTAMCRARHRVVWTCTVTGVSDGHGMPSRFLPLVADMSIEEALRPPDRSDEPTTPLDAEGWLRRRLRDPTLDASVRLAALDALISDAAWRPRDPSTFAGFRRRGHDDGLVPPDAVLSPSQADGYRTCPRRYAFERRLGIGDGGSVYAEFGSVIHDVLEEVELTATERGEPHGSLDEAIAALERRWQPGPFGGGPWAAAWRKRAERVLGHLYDHWPSHGEGVASELPVSLKLDGRRWVGRIDRIEVEDGTARIVDYKTSANPMTVKEAASSVQLGFYVLATSGDDSASSHPIGGAEFWYPARQGASVATRVFDMDLLEEVEAELRAVAEGIHGERWEPNIGSHCERCQVRSVCPAWPEGTEAFTS